MFLLLIYCIFIFYFNIILLFIYHYWLRHLLCVKPKPRLEEKVISLSKRSSCLGHWGSHIVWSLMTIPARVGQFKGFVIRRMALLPDETLNLVLDSRDLF